MKLKVIDNNSQEVYLGFTIEIEAVPKTGEIIQNANGLKFEVVTVLHRKHVRTTEHIIEIHLGEKLK